MCHTSLFMPMSMHPPRGAKTTFLVLMFQSGVIVSVVEAAVHKASVSNMTTASNLANFQHTGKPLKFWW